MKEKVSGLSKGDARRNEIAWQVKNARRRERGVLTTYQLDRSGFNYVHALEGLESLFQYVRSLSSNMVLDIGAGTTKGARDLSKCSFGQGLRFEATVLNNTAIVQANLGRKHTHVVPAETLRGIADSSVGCAIAVLSIGYSTAPSLVVESCDRVLAPGGVLKATFLPQTDTGLLVFSSNEMQPIDKFCNELRKRGYDVATKPKRGEFLYDILLAIKSGNPSAPTAESLLEADAKSFVQQAEDIKGV